MNACFACKQGKRKCTKSRPSCASCLRLGKPCLYTEDTVQTHFDVEIATGHGGNSGSPFGHGTTTEFGNEPSCSKDGHGHKMSRSKEGHCCSQMTGLVVTEMRTLAARSSLPTLFSNSSMDPFFKLPGRLSEQGREAIYHLYRGTFHPILAMRNCGLLNRIKQTAAFFQLLAFSSWHLAVVRNERQTVYSSQYAASRYAARAIRELQKQIYDPLTCTTVESIMAVLVFASSSAQMQDPETAKVHIEGAQRMIEHRGSRRSIEFNTWEGAILFWVETVACSFADLPLHFPAPTEYLMEYKRSNRQLSQWIEINVVDPTISPVFSDPAALRAVNAIREIQIILRSEAIKKDISQDTYLASNHVLPIFYDLLRMLDHDRSSLQEGFRLAAMLFLHELQAMYWGRIPPPLFVDKLHCVLSSNLDWSSRDPTLFWILAVALTSDIATQHHKACFIRKFRHLVEANRITNFDSFMRRVTQISWNYDVLEMRTEVLRSYFEENCLQC